MYKYQLPMFLCAALLLPAGIGAQDRDRQEHRDGQQALRYEDTVHHDAHEWNDTEDQRYRQYLKEHHKRYRNFAKARKNEQSEYWNWVHTHEGDRH